MKIIRDKISQGLNRITFARNEIALWISILDEKEISEKAEKEGDFSPSFYYENQRLLFNIYQANWRMTIIDLYTITFYKEENSYVEINKSLKGLKKSKIEYFEKMNEYLDSFEEEILEYSDLIERIRILRVKFVAHTNGISSRIKYKDVGVDVYELEEFVKFLFAYFLISIHLLMAHLKKILTYILKSLLGMVQIIH